jgi:DNA-binding MurR/RpiR family transcriptional regulator|tara:strand:+ start:219 stop:1052 length:834 start_codon:yes stop_codon:yes gene_type:complete
LKARHQKLSKKQQRIINHILEYPEEIVISGSVELARKLRVDRSTLIAACRNLGYNGYKDLRKEMKRRLSTLKIGGVLDRLMAEFKDTDRLEESIISSITSDISSLQLTVDKLNLSIIKDVSTKIINASSIYIVGLGYLGSLAFYFKSLLKTVRPGVIAITNYHGEVFDTINNLEKNDLVIAFAFDRCMSETVDLFRAATNLSIPTISITDNSRLLINELATNALLIHNSKEFFFTPHVPALSLCNAIMHCVVEKTKPDSLLKIDQYSQMAKKRNVYV